MLGPSSPCLAAERGPPTFADAQHKHCGGDRPESRLRHGRTPWSCLTVSVDGLWTVCASHVVKNPNRSAAATTARSTRGAL